MDVATPQSDLYSKLLQIGWTLQKIDFKQGVYIAKAENETTGQEIERIGKSPEMALAAVVRFAQGAYEIRRMAGLSKLAAWDGDFLDQGQDIAQAYSKMPPFEEKAVPAWKALAAESKIQADAIKRQITVEVVDDPDPYQSVQEMQNDVHKNRHLSVTRADSQHPVWSAEDVVNFRTVSDVIGHAQSGADFSWTGENKAFAIHAPLLSPMAREALFTETIGRAAYDKSFRGSGPHKIGFLSQFLHPVQERQGEHVWVPHGGLPDLSPAPAMEQPNADAMFEQPGGWQYSSPAFERDPAVMEGYKPKKMSYGWHDPAEAEPQQAEWATHIPCPTNIPIKPEREIECPDWEPSEEPLTVPEEWPEEAPSTPEREREPAHARVRVSNEDLPLHYSQEPGYGWKILLGMEDGSLRSPSQETIWPVGQPLVADIDRGNFARYTTGIHLVPEGDWSELYDYSDRPNAILVKCKLYGRYYEGSTDSGRGILATKAMPVLAVGRDQELLLRIANKYGIDTEMPQGVELHDGGVTVFQGEDGWKLVDPNADADAEDHALIEPSYKNFTFDRPRQTSTIGNVVYDLIDPDNQPQGFIEMRLDDDYHGRIDECVVEKIQIPDETDEAIAFVKQFFQSLPCNAEYDRNQAWEHGDYESKMSDYRDSDSVSDAADLVALVGDNESKGYSLEQMSWDGWSYESDDSDIKYNLGDPDEYGVRPWQITIMEDAPPELKFDPTTWQNIFREELETLEGGWQEPDSSGLAQALVQVPQFILTEGAQNNTSSFKEWEQVGGLAFIRQQINEARFQFGQGGEHAPLEVTDWLYQIESTLAGSQSFTPDQQQVVEPIETWQMKHKEGPQWIPWQEANPDQEQIPGTLSKVAGRDPDYLFVYYKSELRVKKWEHDLREADMLEELLDEFDVDMGNTGLDIDPAEVAAGEIFAYPDGEYRIEHKQLSNPEVREHAEDLLDEWLDEWRSLNQARDPSSGQFV